MTVILVTHSLDLLSETCTRALLLEPGLPCVVGSAQEIADALRRAHRRLLATPLVSVVVPSLPPRRG